MNWHGILGDAYNFLFGAATPRNFEKIEFPTHTSLGVMRGQGFEPWNTFLELRVRKRETR